MALDRLVTTAIIGAGNRSLVYSAYALQHPDKMRIVAVADPDESRQDIISCWKSRLQPCRQNSRPSLGQHRTPARN